MSARRDSPNRAYGDQLGSCFWLEKTDAHVTRSLKRGLLAVTQIRSDEPTPQPSQAIGYDDAYLIGLMVDPVADHDLWQDERAVRTPPFAAGTTALYDLRRNPVSYTRCAHHSLHFYIPRVVLTDLAERENIRFTGELRYRFAESEDDPVVRALGHAVLPVLGQGGAVTDLYLDHILHAMTAHVLGRYGQTGAASAGRTGGLTARQLRLVQELMESNLAADVSLAQLAAACQLSVPHLSRAFRRSTGVAPYRWLLDRRIEEAKRLLANPQARLAEVALDCGFADQSHLTRAFTARVGISPGRWVREQRG